MGRGTMHLLPFILLVLLLLLLLLLPRFSLLSCTQMLQSIN